MNWINFGGWALMIVALASTNLSAQHASPAHVDTTIARQLTPGVSFRQIVDQRGPFVIDVVRVDLRRSDIELRHVRAHDALQGRERPSEISARINDAHITVLAAVNADFFDLATGENENNQVIDGEWWKGLEVTDSPFDTYDNAHIQFGIDPNRHPLMDRFILDAHVIARTGKSTPILTINHLPNGKYEGTALYTSRFGATTPHDTARQVVEAQLTAAGKHGDTLLFRRSGPLATTSGSAIPQSGAVLSAYGPGVRQDELRALADGDTVRVLLNTLPHTGRRASPPRLIVGGWPRILRDGQIITDDSRILEGTISRNAEMRHGRTSVGFTRDSTTLILLAVDGRSKQSVGMTLTELATTMKSLGAWQAMNFDGGGSTTMVVEGKVVNVPSDSTGERAVGNALLVVRKR